MKIQKFIIGKPVIPFKTRCPHCQQKLIRKVEPQEVRCNNTNCKGYKKPFIINPAESNPQTYIAGILKALIDKGEIKVQVMFSNKIYAKYIIDQFTKIRKYGGIPICNIKGQPQTKKDINDKITCLKCGNYFYDKEKEEPKKCPYCGNENIPNRKQRTVIVQEWHLKLTGQLY